jgi:RNA polymerase sigma-70 factor, ECF subfamily
MTDRSQPGINEVGDRAALSVDGHLSSADLFKQFAPFVVMQEVFLVAHKLGGYSPGPAKPTTYLANIALRAATTHRRKQQVRSFVRANDELVGASGGDVMSPERSAESRRQLKLLQAALDQLDDDKRAIFVMAELHGESVVSIAAGLGIPVDTAYSRLRAARRLFREAAEALFGAEASPFAADFQRAQP